ncbi:MAG TPA: PHP domain-containing protein [Gemmatimonadaceae bacterium]|nr:PHP domain-containing protein [Gemmatimonadaceae bacterium]
MTGSSPSGDNAGAFVDLHAHSTASDGSRAPADVVREAKRIGLAAIAITDHDTVAGITEATAMAEELGVRVVPGVELSAVEGDVETHILGLHLSDTRELEAKLVALREMRRTRAERMVLRLNELGVRIEFASVLEQAAGGAIGRPHVARAMIAEGWAVDFRDAFDRYLGNGRPAYVTKERLVVAEATSLIHRAGGLAVLAHPSHSGTKERIAAFVEQGMDGIEVRHPSHSAEDTARLAALVEHFSLVPSGGSDWHGSADGPRTLGMMRVPAEWLGRQDSRIRVRAA